MLTDFCPLSLVIPNACDSPAQQLKYTRATPAPKPTLARPVPLPLPPRTDRVLVWSPATRTIVGGELEWKQLCATRYALACDWDWDRCLEAAALNKDLHTTHEDYINKVRFLTKNVSFLK